MRKDTNGRNKYSLRALIKVLVRHPALRSLVNDRLNYVKIVCDVKGGERQRAWTEEALETLDEKVKAFKKMLPEPFYEHC